MKKIALVICGLIIVLTIFSFYDIVSYGFNQAKGQLTIISNTQSVEEAMQSQELADSLKRKITLIQEIRQYAFDYIGLISSNNYTTFYDQKGETLLWNLSASQPFELEPKIWSFPILGKFPYKGYFDFKKAKKEYDELKSNGYDARIRSVGGWSTLGWFKDPILSNMLERSDGSLAELIIHELTHSTLFVKDNIEFNENLASFIGEQGAVLFLKYRFGNESYELQEYIQSEEDSKAFTNHMLLATSKLDSSYTEFHKLNSDSIKRFSKHLLIDEIISSLDTIKFHNKRYNEAFKQVRPNNAYFLSYLRYHSAEDSLNNILTSKHNGNLSRFITAMKKHHE